MTRWHIERRVFLVALLVALLGSLLSAPIPVRAQESAGEAASGEEGQAEESEEVGGTRFDTSDTDLDTIEDLLAQDSAVMADPKTYNYDPGTRRDPFRSLLETLESAHEEVRDRPAGKPGLLIEELVVEGVFELLDGPVAQVQSAREKTSYLLRPGDELWDGDVISISLNEVVFKQAVDDPTALKPFREVVKRLNP